MAFLIAEISNHHLGSVDKAKELILAAKNSGANAVKGQAFIAEDMLKWGTMPRSFYEKCALKYHEYKELVLYGDKLGIPVFFTILSNKFNNLGGIQKFKKLHAGGSKTCRRDKFWHFDTKDHIISMNEPREDTSRILNAHVLYATPYLMDVDLEGYERLQKFYDRDIGISHHGKQYEMVVFIKEKYNVPMIEKHFYLGDYLTWEGQVYRDCLHSFTPKEFEAFAKRVG